MMSLAYWMTFVVFAALLLLMNLSAFYSKRASDQARLDAVTLSMCHARANFIQEEGFAKNKYIRGAQVTLDVAAATAVAICANLLTIKACPAAIRAVRMTSKPGIMLEAYVETRLKAYPGQAALRLRKLLKDNNLELTKVDQALLAADNYNGMEGLEHQEVSAVRKGIEIFFQVKYPKELVVTDDFTEQSRIHLALNKRMNPKVLAESKRDPRKINFVHYSEIKPLPSGEGNRLMERTFGTKSLTEVNSTCVLTAEGEPNEPKIQVKRRSK